MRGFPTWLAAALFLVGAACSRSPEYYFARADSLAAEGKTEDALLMYRKAVSVNPNFGEAYYRMGGLLWKNHQAPEAYAALSTAVRLLPRREDVKVKLAELELAAYLGDRHRPAPLHDNIRDLVNQVLAANSQSYDGMRLKAHLAAADRNYQAAEQLYAEADRLKPLEPELILGWTEVLLEDDQPREAERQAYRLITANKTYGPIYDILYKSYAASGRLAEAGNILRMKVDNNPGNAGALLEVAAFDAEAGHEEDMQALLRQMLADRRTFPDARLQAGDLYFRLQRWDDALRQYQAGAADDPKRRISYLRKVADVWLAQGKGERAGPVVDEILSAVPRDPSARGVKASLLLTTGKPGDVDKAVEELKELVGSNAANPVWHFNLGRGLAAKGDAEGARVQFQEAVNLRPRFLPPRLALLELSEAHRDYAAALQYANAILAIYPDLVRIKLVRTVSLMYTGQDAAAHAEIARLEHDYPQDPEIRMQRAVMNLRDRKFQDAEDHFRKLAAQSKNDPRALNGLVQTLMAENQTDRAITVLEEELRHRPDSIPVRSILARTAALTGKYDLAIEQYRQLVSRAPNSAATCLALGTTYRMKGDFPNAILYLGKARTLDSKDPVPMIRLAGVMALTGRQFEALTLYRDALKLKPDDAAALSNAAYLIAETGGNLDEAMKFAQRAMQLDRGAPGYADTLGWVYLKRRLNDSALQIFRGLTEKYPADATYHYHFALSLLVQGDKAHARAELQTALNDKPSDEVRRKAEMALSKVG